jgi:hypothetical protein
MPTVNPTTMPTVNTTTISTVNTTTIPTVNTTSAGSPEVLTPTSYITFADMAKRKNMLMQTYFVP